MAIHNRILKLATISSCIFLLVACSNNINKDKSYNFPTNEKGYPDKVTLIDNKSYELKKLGYDGLGEKTELKVAKSTNEFTKILLPKLYPTHSWKLEGENDTILKENKTLEFNIDEKNRVDGYSSELQEYIINNKEISNNKLIFKWKNLDIEEDPYILTIIFK